MRKFGIGLAIGLALGAAVPAVAATVAGSGYLNGWTVTVDGEEICDSPYAWTGTREIECDS